MLVIRALNKLITRRADNHIGRMRIVAVKNITRTYPTTNLTILCFVCFRDFRGPYFMTRVQDISASNTEHDNIYIIIKMFWCV